MDIKTLTGELSVTTQITAADLQAVCEAGFKQAKADGSAELVTREFDLLHVVPPQLAPSFPKWLIDGTKPSTLAWLLKERILPPLYWDGMLKGREWMAQPEMVG